MENEPDFYKLVLEKFTPDQRKLMEAGDLFYFEIAGGDNEISHTAIRRKVEAVYPGYIDIVNKYLESRDQFGSGEGAQL